MSSEEMIIHELKTKNTQTIDNSCSQINKINLLYYLFIILNKMYLSLNQKLCLVTIVFISLLKCMNCDCGPPGIPSDGVISTEIKSSYSENTTIEYKCNDGNKLVYHPIRICRERKWTGRVPKCGIYSILDTLKSMSSSLT
jgi:hypothetical protein